MVFVSVIICMMSGITFELLIFVGCNRNVTQRFLFFKNYKSNGKDTNHPLIVSKKTTAKFIGKNHWMIQNLNQVSFYKRNSAPSAVKIDCQERKGFREVSTRQRKMIL